MGKDEGHLENQNKNGFGKCTWALILQSLSRKPLNVAFVKSKKKREQENILYQTPSIPKVKTKNITLVYSINQRKK